MDLKKLNIISNFSQILFELYTTNLGVKYYYLFWPFTFMLETSICIVSYCLKGGHRHKTLLSLSNFNTISLKSNLTACRKLYLTLPLTSLNMPLKISIQHMFVCFHFISFFFFFWWQFAFMNFSVFYFVFLFFRFSFHAQHAFCLLKAIAQKWIHVKNFSGLQPSSCVRI